MWKCLKSLGLTSKKDAPSKICLKNDDNVTFNTKTNAETLKYLFAGLAQNLVDQLPAPTNKFEMESVNGYYQHIGIDVKMLCSNQPQKKLF